MVAAAAFDEVAEEVCDTLAFLHRLQRAGKLDKEGPRQGSTRTKLIQSLYRLIDAQLASTEVGRVWRRHEACGVGGRMCVCCAVLGDGGSRVYRSCSHVCRHPCTCPYPCVFIMNRDVTNSPSLFPLSSSPLL